MTKVKSVGVVSFAKVAAVIYGLIGVLYGGLFFLTSLIGASFAEELGMGGFGILGGLAALVLIPLLFAFIGFIGGLIGGFLYNIALKFAGGLEIELEKM
ncbi:MAG: hypothetical protein ACPG8W_11445 [Candidatus Promineifilaceae bacterium]